MLKCLFIALTSFFITNGYGQVVSPWSITGNDNTDPTTNVLGTTNDKGLSVITNNEERFSLSNIGAAKFKTPLQANSSTPVFTIEGGLAGWNNRKFFEINSFGNVTFQAATWGEPWLSYTAHNGIISSGQGTDVNFSKSGQVIANYFSGVRLRGSTWFNTEILIDRPWITYRPTGAAYIDPGIGAHNFTVLEPITTNSHLATFSNGGPNLITITKDGKLLIGNNDLTKVSPYALAVNGSAIFTKAVVKLNGNWPDYVFNKNYKLQPLNELESFIKKNKHLPGIPPAREVGRDGIDLGQHQTALLEKVEQLTLYIIEINKKVLDIQKENVELKKRVKELIKK